MSDTCFLHKFASINRSTDVVYGLASFDFIDRWWQHSFQKLSDNYVEYATLGDGMTQHSPWKFVKKEHAADYFMSLAHYVIHHVWDNYDELMDMSDRLLVDVPSDDALKFFSSLRYNAEKRSWYCRQEYKVSSKKQLEFDKRWHEITPSHDGQIASIIAHSISDDLSLPVSPMRRIRAYDRLQQLHNKGEITLTERFTSPCHWVGLCAENSFDDPKHTEIAYRALRNATEALKAMVRVHSELSKCVRV